MKASILFRRSVKSVASLTKARIGYPKPSRGAVHIFAYHRVVADIAKAEREAVYGILISTPTFRKHCEMLKAAYEVVPLEVAAESLSNPGKNGKPMAVITFDDGYLDFYEEAFPVLRDLDLPATVFLPTAYIGQKMPLAHDRIFWLLSQARERSIDLTSALKRSGAESSTVMQFKKTNDLLVRTDLIVYLPDVLREKIIGEFEREIGDSLYPYPAGYQLLDWNMVREMSENGINFGSHTARHVVLPLEEESVISRELKESRVDLERHLGATNFTLAYPNGQYDPSISATAALNGYRIAVTTEVRLNGPNADLLALGRTSLCEESTRGLKGSYSPGIANLRLGV